MPPSLSYGNHTHTHTLTTITLTQLSEENSSRKSHVIGWYYQELCHLACTGKIFKLSLRMSFLKGVTSFFQLNETQTKKINCSFWANQFSFIEQTLHNAFLHFRMFENYSQRWSHSVLPSFHGLSSECRCFHSHTASLGGAVGQPCAGSCADSGGSWTACSCCVFGCGWWGWSFGWILYRTPCKRVVSHLRAGRSEKTSEKRVQSHY